MYTATRIVSVCTGILALLTVVGGYSCTITQIYFYICFACLYYSYGSLNTNVNSVKYMPAANAHTLMHVHTLTLSHTCAHKAHTRTYMRCFLQCPLPPLPSRQENLTNPAAYVHSTVVTAFKYTITDQPQPIDVLLKACTPAD